MTYAFFRSCVGWPEGDIDALHALVDNAIGITRRTFLQYVDREDLARLEAALGFAAHHRQGLTMAQDWAVSYHRGKLHGRRAYFFKFSAIEYVFTGGKDARENRHH